MRAREITCWFAYRYDDTLPDDDAGRDDLAVLVNYLVQVNRHDPIGAAAREARAWAPWLTEADARRMAEHAIMHPRKYMADTLAEKLGVTEALRAHLGFTTIGASDLTRAERNKARRKRKTDAERDRRRRNGAVPRAQYRANSLSRSKPWEAEGISRRTWERRRVTQVRGRRIEDFNGRRTLASIPIESGSVSLPPPSGGTRGLAWSGLSAARRPGGGSPAKREFWKIATRYEKAGVRRSLFGAVARSYRYDYAAALSHVTVFLDDEIAAWLDHGLDDDAADEIASWLIAIEAAGRRISSPNARATAVKWHAETRARDG
jgi:hypothetical protein